MTLSKKLSNPFSTGGGGSNFEAHIQSSFVALMLSGGHAPCLPCWPIVEVKLQGKIDGFETDDLIVVVEEPSSKEQRKLLGQVKHSINITAGSSVFGEVIQAAWSDFNNSKVFNKGKDIIALITGPLTATDAEVAWILNHARSHKSEHERFFRNIETANFSSHKKRDKLQVIRGHLRVANGGEELTDEDFHGFLASFYLLGYDLGEDEGVVLSLINSHISQFKPSNPRDVWSRIREFISNRNQHAGHINLDDLPEDLISAFSAKPVSMIPSVFSQPQVVIADLSQHPDATYLSLMVLIGAWEDGNQTDNEIVEQLLGISYEKWLSKAREILHFPNSPLKLKNGVWAVVSRIELWEILGDRILDHDLDNFKNLAISVLQEHDPAFELPVNERYAASVYGKEFKSSQAIRKGIAEGLAILGNQSKGCINCSLGRAKRTSELVIFELLQETDWVLWGSLNNLFPILAESAPSEFLNAVEGKLLQNPNVLEKLFAEETNGLGGGNYLTGLLWALESLAWEEEYLVRVCVTLAELASHDPGGRWSNRPINSLITILLPWMPQTLAPVSKRTATVETLFREQPDIAWQLLIKLLPSQSQTTSSSYRPSWRKAIPEDWEPVVTNEEYWEQVSFYAELIVKLSKDDLNRLSSLIEYFDRLPESTFEPLIQNIGSSTIKNLPEEERISFWEQLTRFTNKHRRFSDAKWALPQEIVARIEEVANELAPIEPFNLYQHLFSGGEFDFYDMHESFEEQEKEYNSQRNKAILEVFKKYGIEGVIRFSKSVFLPIEVGYALAAIEDSEIEQRFFPSLLFDVSDNKLKELVRGFVSRRYYLKGMAWCVSLDSFEWLPEQKGQFLAYLPFTKETWDCASKWLQEHDSEYWSRVDINALPTDDNIAIAVEKLIENKRPRAAIYYLGVMLHRKRPIDSKLCIQALLEAVSSSESTYALNEYHTVNLIKNLQSDPLVTQEELFSVEWAYQLLLYDHPGVSPQTLEWTLANKPNFFCELIQLIYRSNKEVQPLSEPTEESRSLARVAWRLIYEWTTIPGTQKDGAFDVEIFQEWLQKVKETCLESGHLEVALVSIGEVFIHAPSDPDGLWIHQAVAEALSERDANEMRDGYRTGAYNSRGAHIVDPTGEAERELAEQFRNKAEEVEKAGFHRFAVTLRELAGTYKRQAERVIDRYGDNG